MSDRLVSIIIPCYNGEEFLNRSIGSIYKQDYLNIELIIVDDGSTDGSKKIIETWEKKFEEQSRCLKYVYQKNGGLGSAINRGLKEVSGSYLLLLDADDRLLQGSILKQAGYLDTYKDVAVVRTNGYKVRGENRWLIVQEEEEKEENLFELLIFGKTNNWAGTYMVRTELLWLTYPDREIYSSRDGQNFQILLPVSYQRKAGFIDEPLMEYIQTDKSLSRSKYGSNLQRDVTQAEQYYDIKIHVLKQFLPRKDLDKYLELSYIQLLRYQMLLAKTYQNKEEMKKYYRSLCEKAKPSLDDRITYYQCVNRWISYVLRFFRKLNNI